MTKPIEFSLKGDVIDGQLLNLNATIRGGHNELVYGLAAMSIMNENIKNLLQDVQALLEDPKTSEALRRAMFTTSHS